MSVFTNLKIGVRITMVMALFSVALAAVAWIGVTSIDRYEDKTNEITNLFERSVLSQRVRVELATIQTDTRDIYGAKSTAELNAAVERLNENISDVRAIFNEWEKILPQGRRADFETTVRAPFEKYFKTRQEIVDAAKSGGEAAAREVAYRPDVVQQRNHLLKITADRAVNNREVAAKLNDGLTDYYNTQRPMLIGISAAAIAVSLCLGLAISILTISRPIQRMTTTMRTLADGNTAVNVDGSDRGDEIGQMAKTVLVFKDNMIAREKAEADIAEQRRVAEEQRSAREARERKAIGEISELCDKAAAGDLDTRLNEADKDGFLLTISQRLNGLTGMLQQMTGEMAQVTGAMSQGDLSRDITGSYHGVFGSLKDSVNGMAEKLRDIAARLSESAALVKDASAEISTGSQDLAQRTESQAASIEETAASMHEITATVKQNADNAQAASQLASSARDAANKGGNVMSMVVDAMGRIEGSAGKISDIVGLIEEIAFQTNLLALNASVEAARAGEAGKGFAVVAQEVRALAQRAANASRDIKSLITESNGQVREGGKLVGQAGETLTEIVGAVKKVTDIVSEIAAASREQSTGLEQINTAVGTMDEMTQRNGALVEETSASANALSTQAAQLAELVGFFRTAGQASGSAALAAGKIVNMPKSQPARDRRSQPVAAAKTTAQAKVAVKPAASADKVANEDWQEF